MGKPRVKRPTRHKQARINARNSLEIQADLLASATTPNPQAETSFEKYIKELEKRGIKTRHYIEILKNYRQRVYQEQKEH